MDFVIFGGKKFTDKYIQDRIEVNKGGCWIWQGRLSPGGKWGGYGLGMGGNAFMHRVAFALYKGEIPPKAQVDHRCRNHVCCNPAHLELVNRSENVARGYNARTGRMAWKRLRVARFLHDEVGKR